MLLLLLESTFLSLLNILLCAVTKAFCKTSAAVHLLYNEMRKHYSLTVGLFVNEGSFFIH
jgi:hypothetical protein